MDSMGGAIAVRVAAKRALPTLAGLVVIDVVEVRLEVCVSCSHLCYMCRKYPKLDTPWIFLFKCIYASHLCFLSHIIMHLQIIILAVTAIITYPLFKIFPLYLTLYVLAGDSNGFTCPYAENSCE